jgi:hypothetical protein
MTTVQWTVLGIAVAAILALVPTGFAAMSTNPPFVVPKWVPKIFFALSIAVASATAFYLWNTSVYAQIIAVVTVFALLIYLIWPLLKRNGGQVNGGKDAVDNIKGFTKLSDKEIEDTIHKWIDNPSAPFFMIKRLDAEPDTFFGFVVFDPQNRPVTITRHKEQPYQIALHTGIILGEEQKHKFEAFPEPQRADILRNLRVEMTRLGISNEGICNPFERILLKEAVPLEDSLTEFHFVQRIFFVRRAYALIMELLSQSLGQEIKTIGFKAVMSGSTYSCKDMVSEITEPKLSNRDELLRGIDEARMATHSLIDVFESVKTWKLTHPNETNIRLFDELKQAVQRSDKACEAMEREILVAGKSYEQILKPLYLFIKSSAIANAGPENDKGVLLVYKRTLDDMVINVRNTIDEISQPASRKEGSQT